VSIHKRSWAAGKKEAWVVRWRESGAQRQVTVNSYEDAVFVDASVKRARRLGQLGSELIGSDQTVEEFLDEWWEKHAEAYLKPGTLISYAYVLDKWIKPHLGRMQLRDVSRETIGTYVSTLRSRGAGAPTINPFAGVPRQPHVRSSSIDARAPEVVEAVRATLEREHAALVSVLAYEGLRAGEAFALEWRDILDERGLPRERLAVRRALSGGDVSTPKSGRAREPELFGPVATEFAELYMAHGRPRPGTLVFADAAGGHLRRQNWRQRVWIPALAAAFPCAACERAGEVGKRRCSGCAGKGTSDYFRPHDLRHTCATLLIYEGRTVNEVADHLGHADPGFTARVYAHVLKDASKRRRIPIEQAISSARAATSSEAASSWPGPARTTGMSD
jgi:integrase